MADIHAALLNEPHERASPSVSCAQIIDEVLDTYSSAGGYEAIEATQAWRSAGDHWREAGLLPFLRDEVPFAVNNDSALSRQSAELLLESCLTLEHNGSIEILELGAGIGLHARYLLDSFEELCERGGYDFYDRLRFIVTDISTTTVSQWMRSGLFEAHADKVCLASCDTLNLTSAITLEGETVRLQNLAAVFVNYILDVLPAGVFRRSASGWEELHLRALRRNVGNVRQAFAGAEAVADALNATELESRFLPTAVDGRLLEQADIGLPSITVNHGALACLEELLDRLADDGFILVNDYGFLDEAVINRFGPDRFGPTLAWALNFPLIERHVQSVGGFVAKPHNQEGAAVYSRLIAKRDSPQVTSAFCALFDASLQVEIDSLLETARQHVRADATALALRTFQNVLTRRPRDWRMMGEIAEMLIAAGRFEAALRVSSTAIEINPWFSPSLWNLAGDALYHLGRFEEAEEKYRVALSINPADARVNFNLAFTRIEAGDDQGALVALAHALASDHHGGLQAQILAKQKEILDRKLVSSTRRHAEHHALLHAIASPLP